MKTSEQAEELDRELMLVVERCVRGIRCSHTRKMTMRRDLYALLWEHYQDSLARGKTEAEAKQESVQAFGDVEELRSQLQATVPIFERSAAVWDRWLFPMQSERLGVEEFSLSESANAGLRQSCLLFLALFVPGVLLGFFLNRSQNAFFQIWPTLCTLVLIYGWNAMWMFWCGSHMVFLYLQPDCRNRSVRFFWSSLLVGLSCGGTVLLLYGSVGWEALQRIGWQAAAISVPVSTLMFWGIIRLIVLEKMEQHPWILLELDTDSA